MDASHACILPWLASVRCTLLLARAERAPDTPGIARPTEERACFLRASPCPPRLRVVLREQASVSAAAMSTPASLDGVRRT